MYAQIHSRLSICDQTHPPLCVSFCLPVQWQLSCPQRDDWKSVALPLQSYRSTAAGVSSSALPPRSPTLVPSPPFVLLAAVSCCHPQASVGITHPVFLFPHQCWV